jgi:signal transduction histidine kinase
MDRGDVLSGAAFAAVLRSSVLFLVVLVAMAVFSVGLIDRAASDDLRLRVTELEESLLRQAEGDTPAELAARVDAAAHAAAGDTLAYALLDAEGTRLAGNVTVWPRPGEWMTAQARLETSLSGRGDARDQTYLLHATRVGDLVLVTGRSTAIVASARSATIWGFVLSGGLVVIAMLGIGYVLSWRSQIKLNRIEATLNRVATGEVSARIEDGADDTQIDRIARRINTHLDQLEGLMQGTRRTAASVAHDLRRPLARATLSLEKALAQAEAGRDPRGEIEDTLADLGRLTGIIATILRIARIEGAGALSLEPVDLRPVLDEIADTFQPVAEDSGQHLIYESGGEALRVRGDAGMLAQLVVNLVQNALTHAGDGARIRLAAECDAGAVVLRVSDSGPGIPAALRAQVFEPFFRADESRTVEGSGLGLPLVKAIAERHGATVQLGDAAPGLCVTVRFPHLAES